MGTGVSLLWLEPFCLEKRRLKQKGGGEEEGVKCGFKAREAMESPILARFKSRWDIVMGNFLWVSKPEQGTWKR